MFVKIRRLHTAAGIQGRCCGLKCWLILILLTSLTHLTCCTHVTVPLWLHHTLMYSFLMFLVKRYWETWNQTHTVDLLTCKCCFWTRGCRRFWFWFRFGSCRLSGCRGRRAAGVFLCSDVLLFFDDLTVHSDEMLLRKNKSTYICCLLTFINTCAWTHAHTHPPPPLLFLLNISWVKCLRCSF